MAYVIFDLDGTVICSKHRQNTLSDGSLDLEHWLEHNTYEKIMGDSLLPLARIMRSMKIAGHKIIVCTARTPHEANIEFLLQHELHYDVYLSRGINDWRGDAELKVDLLRDYFMCEGFSSVADAKAIMFEDNLTVINALQREGVTIYDANLANANFRKIEQRKVA